MIFDYMYTYGGPELFVLFSVFVATPLVYLFILRRVRWQYRLTSILMLWLIAITVSFADVYLIAREARRLCSIEAGLHVFHTAQIDGLVGLYHIEQLAKFGLTFVEFSVPGSKKKFRETLKNGRPFRIEVPNFVGKYEFTTFDDAIGDNFTRIREVIRNIDSKDILGEMVTFRIFPGWLDRRLIGVLGLAWTPPACDGNFRPEAGRLTLSIQDLVQAVRQAN